MVRQAGKVVEIQESRLPELPRLAIEDVNGGPAGAEMNALPANFQIMTRIEAGQDESLGRLGDGRIDEALGKVKAPAFADPAAGIADDLPAGRNGIGHAKIFQQVPRAVEDARQFAFPQRLVPPAGKAGPEGTGLQRILPLDQTGLTPATAFRRLHGSPVPPDPGERETEKIVASALAR